MGKKIKMRRKVFSFCICQLQLPRQSTTDREAPTTTDQEALTMERTSHGRLGKSKTKVLADSVPGESPPPGLLTATFSLCPPMAKRQREGV